MDHKSTVAFRNVNLVDKVNDDPVSTRIPVATMITVFNGRTQEWSKARIIDFSRRMSQR